MLHLVDVDGDNWIADLRVSESQKEYVLLWHIEGDDAAKGLYEHMGFTVSGSVQDEIGMEMEL